MYRIAICDDEKQILNKLHIKIKNCFDEKNIPGEYLCFHDARELMELLAKEHIDLLFLDIDMPYYSGMDIAGFTLERRPIPLLVFVTSHDALVYQSFAYKPFGFIRKTYMDTELPELAERIKKEFNDRKQELTIIKGKEITRILIKEIVYIEAEGNYLNICTEREKIRVRETMANMENELKDQGFIRCHKGYLVNLEFAAKMKTNELEMQYSGSKKVIPISRSYEKDVRKKIFEFIRS